MGKPLQEYLLEYGHDVQVASRSKNENSDVIYHCGNAHNIVFLQKIVTDGYDAIVDFMAHKTIELKERV